MLFRQTALNTLSFPQISHCSMPRGLAKARKAQEDANAPTPEQLIASVNAQRDSLLAAAALRIAPLQYAADLGMSTDLEKANLLDWMRYSVSLNRVEQQPEYQKTVDWPIAPGGF